MFQFLRRTRRVVSARDVEVRRDHPLPRTSGGRLLAVLFAVSGLIALADVLPPDPAAADAGLTLALATLALLLAPVLWFLPWARWPRPASLGILPVAFLLIGFGGIADPNPYTYGLPFITTFLWIGATHRRGTSPGVLPLATVAYVAPLWLSPTPVEGLLGSTVSTLVLGVVLAEVLAWVMLRLSQVQAELARRAERSPVPSSGAERRRDYRGCLGRRIR
jgi:hypothetical protein